MKTIVNLKNIEEFETVRLHARRINENDFYLILPMYQNQTVMETLRGIVPENDVKERFLKSLAAWKINGFDAWLWFENNSNKFVGRAGLRILELVGERVIEVGYALLPDFWNKASQLKWLQLLLKLLLRF